MCTPWQEEVKVKTRPISLPRSLIKVNREEIVVVEWATSQQCRAPTFVRKRPGGQKGQNHVEGAGGKAVLNPSLCGRDPTAGKVSTAGPLCWQNSLQ